MTILLRQICVLVLACGLVPQQQAVTETITPVLLEVRDAPVAFAGSDGKTHLVYELRMTNFSSWSATIDQVEVVGDAGAVLKTMDKGEIAARLQMAGQRTPTDVLPGSAEASLFIHLTLGHLVPPDGPAVPSKLTHRVRVGVEAAPPGKKEVKGVGGETAVDRQAVAGIGPPLRGARYVAADSCCGARRHTRAALPGNGRV